MKLNKSQRMMMMVMMMMMMMNDDEVDSATQHLAEICHI